MDRKYIILTFITSQWEILLMKDLVPAKEAAKKLGIAYSALTARTRRGKVKAIKIGWALFIPRIELERLLEEKDANHKNLEKTTG